MKRQQIRQGGIAIGIFAFVSGWGMVGRADQATEPLPEPSTEATIQVSAEPTTQPSQATPLMALLDRFTAPDVPEMGPGESPVAPRKPSTRPAPADLPGNGLAQHPMLYIGEGYNKMFLINDGKIIWTYSTGPGNELDDVWMLSNGNILFTRMQYLAIITPDKKVVWRYDAQNSTNIAEHTEIHGCQPIGLDK